MFKITATMVPMIDEHPIISKWQKGSGTIIGVTKNPKRLNTIKGNPHTKDHGLVLPKNAPTKKDPE